MPLNYRMRRSTGIPGKPDTGICTQMLQGLAPPSGGECGTHSRKATRATRTTIQSVTRVRHPLFEVHVADQ